MLCTYCTNFDLDALVSFAGYQHHANYTDLVASAKGGCILCEAVRLQNEEAGYAEADNENSRQSSSSIVCSLGLISSTLRWTWQSRGRSMVVAMAVSSVPGDASEKVINATPICTDASSELCFNVMSTWLGKCLTAHTLCSQINQNGLYPRGDNLLPSRVIDVGGGDAEPFLFVSEGISGSWFALSHCWGQTSTLTTEKKTLRERIAGIRMEELPPTFRDAVLITRHLGCQYLWIDSLCIIQDSTEDWLKESAQMGYIYQNSSLTIAAEAAAGSNVGIFSSTNKLRSRLTSIKVPYHRTRNSSREQMYVHHLLDSPTQARGPLSQRAWTLQEDLLSPRILRFAAQQVWWRCREMQCNESDRAGVSLESAWNSHDTYQVVVGITHKQNHEKHGLTEQGIALDCGMSSHVDETQYSQSVASEYEDNTDNEVGFADSDDEVSDADRELKFWTSSRTSYPVPNSYPKSHSDSSHQHDVGLLLFTEQPEKPKTVMLRNQGIRFRSKTPKLREQNPAGIFDEDIPLGNAFLKSTKQRAYKYYKITPQDIDPTFPKSDPEDEVWLSENSATYIDKRKPTLDAKITQGILLKWYSIVNDFAVRKLTYDTDRLPALSGLARAVRRMTGDRYSYKAGIWRTRAFEYQDLLWGVTAPRAVKYEKYVAPSWSWASIDLSNAAVPQDGPRALYNEELLRDLVEKAEIKAMSTKTVSGDPYMQVVSGRLEIEGSCRYVCSCEIPTVFFDLHDESNNAPTGPWDIIEGIIPQASTSDRDPYSERFKDFRKDLIGRKFCGDESGPSKHRNLLLLEVAEWSSSQFQAAASICLILQQRVDLERLFDQSYERVGRAFVLKDPDVLERLSRWWTQTVTIR